MRYKGDLIINLTFIVLIILGGIGFLVLLELFQYGKNGTLSLHAKLALKISLVITMTVLLSYVEGLLDSIKNIIIKPIRISIRLIFKANLA
ncbi:unnamed protein product, partial [marine sediment metagenome]